MTNVEDSEFQFIDSYAFKEITLGNKNKSQNERGSEMSKQTDKSM